METQSAALAFGPDPSEPTTRFNLTSRHVAVDDPIGPVEPPVYAAMTGTVFALPIDDTLCSLVLVPDVQPFSRGAPIAALVARGVLRSSIESSGVIADRSTSDLAARMWTWHDEQRAADEAADPPRTPSGTPQAARLGLGDGLDPSLTLDDLLRGTVAPVVGMRVYEGEHLGGFDDVGFSFEVCTPRGMTGPTIGHLTSLSPVVVGSALVDPAIDPSAAFADRVGRDGALEALDPAVLFGHFARTGLAVRSAETNTPVTIAPDEARTTVLANYAHPSRIWLDVRDHDTNSFDVVLRQADPAVVVAFGGGAPARLNPYAGGWPVVFWDPSNLAGAATKGSGDDAAIAVSVAMDAAGRFAQSVYVEHGITPLSWPQFARGPHAFVNDLASAAGDLTEPVELLIPAVDGAAEPTPWPTLLRLKCCRTFDYVPRESLGDLAPSPQRSHLDGLFPLVNPPHGAPPIGGLGVVARFASQAVRVDDPRWHPEPTLVVRGVCFDGHSVCFLAQPVDRDRSSGPPVAELGLIDFDEPDADDIAASVARFVGQMQATTVPANLGDAMGEAGVIALVPELPVRARSIGRPDPDDLISLVISRQDYDAMLAAATAAGLADTLPRRIGTRFVQHDDGSPAWARSSHRWELTVEGYAVVGGVTTRTSVPTRVLVDLDFGNGGRRDERNRRSMDPSDAWPIARDRRLQSALFAGDPDLGTIGLGLQQLSRASPARGTFVTKVQAALKIVLPELENADSVDRAITSWVPTSDHLETETVQWLARFQQRMLTTIVGAELEVGLLERRTLHLLDVLLDRIVYYEAEPVARARTVHNEALATPVGALTVVSKPTAPVFLEPTPSAPIDEHLAFNDRVLILSLLASTPGPDRWCLITTEGPRDLAPGEDALPVHGYMRLSDLHTASQMPDPFARLHKIQRGDEVLSLASSLFPRSNQLVPGQRANDPRYYANVLLFVNNPLGEERRPSRPLDPATGRYVPGPEVDAAIWTTFPIFEGLEALWDLVVLGLHASSNPAAIVQLLADDRTWTAWADAAALTEDWHNARLKEDSLIWVPSQEMADGLYVHVDSGSISTGMATDLAQGFAAIAEQFVDQTVIDALDLSWPIGHGFTINGSVGATFGIPLSVDADGEFSIWREDETTLKIVRWGEVMPSLDVGVGAGAFFGVGKPPRFSSRGSSPNSDAYWGAGAQIGAQFLAGVTGYVLEELEIPITDIPAIAMVIKGSVLPDGHVAAAGETPRRLASARVIAHRVMSIFQAVNLREDEYRTKLKIKSDRRVHRQLVASGGLRFGPQQRERSAWPSWTNDDRRTNFGKGKGIATNFFGNMLSITLGVSLDTEFSGAVTFELDPKHFVRDPQTGRRVPTRATAELSVDGEAAVSATIPILSSLPVPAPGIGGGLAAKLHWDFEPSLEAFDAGNEVMLGAHKLTVKAYAKLGELDFYDGPAFQAELELDTAPFLDIARSPDSLQRIVQIAQKPPPRIVSSIFTGARFETRLGSVAFSGLTSHFSDHMRRRQLMSALVKPNGKPVFGSYREGYIDLVHELPSNRIGPILGAVYDDLVNGHGQGAAELVQWFHTYAQRGYPPEQRPPSVTRLIEAVDLVEAELHVEFGFGAAVAARVKGGGGLRLRAAAAAAMIYHLDVLEPVRDLGLSGTKSATYRRLHDAGTGAYRVFFEDSP